MSIIYSSRDTIDKYTTLFHEFEKVEEKYLLLNNNRQLIDFSAGLALTNSIHERFVKCIIADYEKLYPLSNTKRETILYKFKGPQKIKEFISIFKLDTEPAYNLLKSELPEPNTITSFDNLVSILSTQRLLRNNYLHGDFNFSDEIVFQEFKSNLIDYQKYHVTILEIVRHTFQENISSLPATLL